MTRAPSDPPPVDRSQEFIAATEALTRWRAAIPDDVPEEPALFTAPVTRARSSRWGSFRPLA